MCELSYRQVRSFTRLKRDYVFPHSPNPNVSKISITAIKPIICVCIWFQRHYVINSYGYVSRLLTFLKLWWLSSYIGHDDDQTYHLSVSYVSPGNIKRWHMIHLICPFSWLGILIVASILPSLPTYADVSGLPTKSGADAKTYRRYFSYTIIDWWSCL